MLLGFVKSVMFAPLPTNCNAFTCPNDPVVIYRLNTSVHVTPAFCEDGNPAAGAIPPPPKAIALETASPSPLTYLLATLN